MRGFPTSNVYHTGNSRNQLSRAARSEKKQAHREVWVANLAGKRVLRAAISAVLGLGRQLPHHDLPCRAPAGFGSCPLASSFTRRSDLAWDHCSSTLTASLAVTKTCQNHCMNTSTFDKEALRYELARPLRTPKPLSDGPLGVPACSSHSTVSCHFLQPKPSTFCNTFQRSVPPHLRLPA